MVEKECRNPVFALEMIQTGYLGYCCEFDSNDVAIQYSPWR